MHRNIAPRVALITGTSSGIGRACARYFSERGVKVYGTSRHPQDAYQNFVPLIMDVTDERSIKEGVQSILDKEGSINILVNNAGIAYAGAVEDMSVAEVQHQFDVNLFGVVRMCQSVFPTMRKQGEGCIITIGSIGGLIGLPYQAFYSASKFALEVLIEGLRIELLGSGIRAVLIEPGDIKTNISRNRIIAKEAHVSSPHSQRLSNYIASVTQSERNARDPEVVARVVFRAAVEQHPRVRYRIGTSMENLGVLLRKFLPSRVFEKIMASNFKL